LRETWFESQARTYRYITPRCARVCSPPRNQFFAHKTILQIRALFVRVFPDSSQSFLHPLLFPSNSLNFCFCSKSKRRQKTMKKWIKQLGAMRNRTNLRKRSTRLGRRKLVIAKH
jgi:spermidine synthase